MCCEQVDAVRIVDFIHYGFDITLVFVLNVYFPAFPVKSGILVKVIVTLFGEQNIVNFKLLSESQ
jgi:hypothetical protein